MFFIWQLLTWPIRFLFRNIRPIFASLVGFSAYGYSIRGARSLFGAEQLLRSEAWDVSFVWIVISIVAGVGGSLAGGSLCYLMDRKGKGTKFLIALVTASGILPLLSSTVSSDATVRSETPDLLELFANAIEPTWLLVATPVLAIVSILTVTSILKKRVGLIPQPVE